MKKCSKLTILMCIVLFTNVLAGCTNLNKKEKVTISILAKNSWYTNVDYSDCEILKKVVENTNYKVEWKLRQPNNYYDTVKPLLLEKNNGLADIIQIPDMDTNCEYISNNIFVALDKYLSEMPNFAKYLDESPGIKASLTANDGHIYYVPQTVLTDNYQPCIMYNMEWLDQLGLEVPSDLDEFVQMLSAFKNNDMNGNGDTNDEIPMSVTKDFLPYMFGSAFGLELVNGFYADEYGKVNYSYYDPDKYKKYLLFLNGLYEEGLLETDFESLTRDEIVNRCKNNITGVTFDYSWQMSTLYSVQYDNYDGSNPIFSGAKPLSGEYEGYYIGRNEISGLFGVSATSNNVKDAVILLDDLFGEKSQEIYCWGVEGESYFTNDDGSKEFTDKAEDDVWLQQLGLNPVCVPSRQSVEATDVLLANWHRNIDKELQKNIKPIFPFIYATQEEYEIDQGYTSYIAKYVASQSIGFITGKVSLSSFDFYLQTLQNMNIENIIHVKQKQYDRYKRSLQLRIQ